MRKLVKSTTLTPGYWTYICPCGFVTSVARVTRKESKWMIYCFHCKQSNGKYKRVMDEKLEFTQNWNGKLNCNAFTTLRLHNPTKYAVGAIKQIYLRGVWKGNARVIQVNRIKLSEISLFISKLDTGLDPEPLRQMLRTMYKNRPGINWEIQLIDFCLLEYIKESKEPKLF